MRTTTVDEIKNILPPLLTMRMWLVECENFRGRSLDLRAPGTSVVTKVFISRLYFQSNISGETKVSGETNKIHSNSSELNVRVGEVTMLCLITKLIQLNV